MKVRPIIRIQSPFLRNQQCRISCTKQCIGTYCSSCLKYVYFSPPVYFLNCFLVSSTGFSKRVGAPLRFRSICCVCSQSFLTPCDPMDCSPPGFSVHEIPEARILEWVAMPFSPPSDSTCISYSSCLGRHVLYH